MNWLLVQTAAQISVERILNALPEGILVALFVWALLRILRRQNSGTRFAVWFLTLLTVIALPLLGSFGEARWAAFGMPSAAQASTQAWGNSQAARTPAILIPGRWAVFVFLAWAVGAGIALVRLAGGLWRLRQLHRSCTSIVEADLDPVVRKTVDVISGSSSRTSLSARSIRIATSERVRVPAAIGFWRRTIVLPTWALRELPAEDLNVILLHELAHLRRWDEWTNLIQKIARALFFFHPAVWWIEQRLSVEREMACDDAVLAETANPRGYASCLISLLEKSLAHRGWSMAQAAVHRAREASLRLAQILDKNRPAATRVWKPALGMAGVFSLVCLAVFPHAPQFVGFDSGTANSGSAYSVVARQSLPQLPAAAIIPAAFRTDATPVGNAVTRNTFTKKGTFAGPPKRSLSGAPSRVVSALPFFAVGLNATPLAEQDEPAQAKLERGTLEVAAWADQQSAPQLQTVVFIETMEYVSRGASVWSVQMWRVTLVSSAHDRLVEVPVINSI
jgi:beta-lactamase regulating signal transducer with metallopeptidase domain